MYGSGGGSLCVSSVAPFSSTGLGCARECSNLIGARSLPLLTFQKLGSTPNWLYVPILSVTLI